MKYLVVPTQVDLPRYQFRVVLSGTVFTLRLKYNTRMERWMLDIADASGVDLVVGLPVLVSRNISGNYVITGLPSGFFFASDDTGAGENPTLDSFQSDKTFFYGDPDQ